MRGGLARRLLANFALPLLAFVLLTGGLFGWLFLRYTEEHHKEDLCASLERTIVEILMKKLRQAAKDTGINRIAVAGGVSANTGLREAFQDHARRYRWKVYIPPFSYTTDNAAMIACTGYFKYLDKDFCGIDVPIYSNTRL